MRKVALRGSDQKSLVEDYIKKLKKKIYILLFLDSTVSGTSTFLFTSDSLTSKNHGGQCRGPRWTLSTQWIYI